MEDAPGRRDPIRTSRRYVLGEEEDSFAIWDREAPGEPIERFPSTAEGFEEAHARYKELKRSRRPRIDLHRLLLGSLVLGVGLSILAALVTAFGGFGLRFETVRWAEIAFALDVLAFPLTVGSLALLVGLALTRFLRADAGNRLVVPGWPGGTLPAALAWMVVAGLVGWVTASLATHLLTPGPEAIFFEDMPGPETRTPTAFRVSYSIASISFRVWVAAAAGFLLLWIRGGRTREPDET